MHTAPMNPLATESFLTLPSLAHNDPTGILPITIGLLMFSNVELGRLSRPAKRAEPGLVTSGRSPEISLSTKAPEYVLQQLRRRYAETGVTIRNQLLLALRKDGIEVLEADLHDERKRQRNP